MEFVQVAVLAAGPFAQREEPVLTYHLTDDLREQVSVGSLVVAPFGQRQLYGIVTALSPESPVPDTRPIAALVDAQPVLTADQIVLAEWIAREYLAPLDQCLELWLPPGIIGYADVLYTLTPEAPSDAANTPAQAKLLMLLARRGPQRGAQLSSALPGVDWRSAAAQLVRRGVVVRRHLLAPPRARPKEVSTVQLAADVDADQALRGLRSAVYPAILAFLQSERGPVDVSWVYAETGCQRRHLDMLAERGAVVLGSQEVWRDPLAGQVFTPIEPPTLTRDQEAAWDVIRPSLKAGPMEPGVFLLHGVTGSGKTEIYLRAVAEVLARGRRAICLIPEIALTPQTVSRFAARFPGRVTVSHSLLSQGERYDTWRRARAGLIDVVIGPRSALFTPLEPLGLVILDEEHEGSYKQDTRPRYHAREAALEIARRAGATVIMGSATPSLDAYYRALRGEFTLLALSRRVLGHRGRLHNLSSTFHVPSDSYRAVEDGSPEACYRPLPPVQIVDLRAEMRAGNRSIFSRPLQQALDDALKRREQAILFLNRRGTATFVLCRDCGHVLHCPQCDLPLTYHGPQGRLVCHRCSYRQPQQERCPLCGSNRMRYFGLGTEQVEQAVQERWPEARLLRWDRDTSSTAEAHSRLLERFASGAADVLIGTQMIAKGLDLPLVTVVGVISADTALNLPDFRASERTFQLLAQVAGRAGRGLLNGQVVIQTYHPDHYAVTAAAAHDYAQFAAQELAFRQQLGYPPYRRLTKLTYEDSSPSHAEEQARALSQNLRELLALWGLPEDDLIGPAPAFFA
ncbi:MAG: primosomal protein N', partial [Anaerolineales bacterium]|nr:primosomal protein N' [Anaerolineales bacterium]